MDDCLFCKILRGEIPAKKIYEDEEMLAFHDVNPQAKVHFLIIPKKHFASLDEINEDDENKEIIGHIFSKIPVIAKSLGLTNGYRVVNNCGDDGNQTVAHIHFHVLGGRKLGWPPG
jgi:histidine triad (HIT) family protein